MFSDNQNFYPTPLRLANKMTAKIKGDPVKILEPSAGKGDLIEAVVQKFRYSNRYTHEISAIEIDPVLQATLRGNEVKLIDSDFLAYSGPDKFDLIIANPPFDEGDKHLLKAIDIMYRGQIIFLLNAETIRNPHTNSRKDLCRRLDELGAEIEFIQNAFTTAERPTNVEVALVNIVIDRKVEDDLFAGCEDHATRAFQSVQDKHEVSTGKTIFDLVSEYNQVIQMGIDTITSYYRNYRKVGKYIGLNREAKQYDFSSGDLTTKMQEAVNKLLKDVRVDFWRRTLDLKEVRSRLTKKKQDEFEHALTAHAHMDFTENNIRQFVLNLIGSYEQTLIDAVLECFDTFTVKHCWNGGVHEKNIHYYNGWKTNKAFKVGKRVVVPIYGGGYGEGPFRDWHGRWNLSTGAYAALRDIDLVMSYFDGGSDYYSMNDALQAAFARGESTAFSTYFKVTAHKKGTVHLTFLDEDVLRRFNVVACRGKGWLPGDFGAKPYDHLSIEEKSVVDSFEGQKSYDSYVNKPLFAESRPGLMKIGFAAADDFREAA